MTLKRVPIDPGVEADHSSGSVHRIFCIDCSGSMSSSLPDIQTQLRNKISSLLRPEDFMSLIWFSGRGQFGAIFEHYSVKNVLDLTNIHQSICQYLRPVGSTGFVEPIRLVKTLIDRYPDDTSQVYFLTDGCENSWPKEECRQAFAPLNGHPTVLVEYGYSCDREMLRQLSEECNGVQIFNEDFPSFEQSFAQFMNNRVDINRRVIQTDSPVVFLDPDTGDVVKKSPQNGKVSIPSSVTEAWILDQDQNQNQDEKEESPRELYVELSALLASREHQKVQTLLPRLGDKFVTRLYGSTFSKQDTSRLIEHIKQCIHHPSENAFKEGVDHNYLAPDDSFTVLRLLQILEADKATKFYPFHSEFQYSRVARKSNDSENRFLPNKSLGCGVVLVYHSSRANVSMQCVVYGHSLDEDGNVKADQTYRTFTVVKDGIKHVSALPVSMSQETFNLLQSEGCIPAGVAYEKNKVYVVDLTHLPVVNRKFVRDSEVSVQEFAQKHIRVLELKSALKYLKKRKVEFEEKGDEKDEEIESSSSSSSYSRSKPDDSVVRDFYTAPELHVKVAKCSTIPTVNDKLIAKLDGNGVLTLSESLMKPIHVELNAVSGNKLEWITTKMEELNHRVRFLVGSLEQAKMAFLIAGLPEEAASGLSVQIPELEQTFQVSVLISDVKVYTD